MKEVKLNIPPFGNRATILLFGGAGLIFYLETHYMIPFLERSTNVETIIWWFVVAGFGMFVPLLLVAFFLLKEEAWYSPNELWENRMRFKPMEKADWQWTLGGIVTIGLLSIVIMRVIQLFVGEVDSQPTFMQFDPLGPGRYWILAAWLPFWVFNIMGEEILWRGVILPRQETSFGKYAWLIQGLGWGFFHLAMGWQLLLILLPILFILPFIVQKRKNTWIGVIIHALLNGPGFIAIALGVL